MFQSCRMSARSEQWMLFLSRFFSVYLSLQHMALVMIPLCLCLTERNKSPGWLCPGFCTLSVRAPKKLTVGLFGHFSLGPLEFSPSERPRPSMMSWSGLCELAHWVRWQRRGSCPWQRGWWVGRLCLGSLGMASSCSPPLGHNHLKKQTGDMMELVRNLCLTCDSGVSHRQENVYICEMAAFHFSSECWLHFHLFSSEFLHL